MEEITIPGFPKVSDTYIELPSIGELIVEPFWGAIAAEDLRKYGTEVQKSILDQVPLTHNRKYVMIQVTVNYLYPGVISVPNKSWSGAEGEWHRDGNGDLSIEDVDVCHLMISPSEASTDFNEHPFSVKIPSGMGSQHLINMINMNMSRYPFTPKTVEPQKFVTFDNHFHRATQTTKHEFRYMYRVIESNYREPKLFKETRRDFSTVHPLGSGIGNVVRNIYKTVNESGSSIGIDYR